MTRIVLLVPRRTGIAERDRAWAWCKARWEAILPEARIYEGHHDAGPFNRSSAINAAGRSADRDGRWDVGIVIDADIFVRESQVRLAIATAVETGRVTWAHRRWRGVSEDWTKRVVADARDFGPELERDDMDLFVERTNPISWSCCIAIPRAVWDDMGGFDERFKGWGFEDMAFQSLVCGLYGHERIAGDVYHLWHPRSEERIVKGKPASTASPEYITNARLGRRYMVALRRDYNLHDRADLPATEEERIRDVENLIHDDEALAPAAAALGLPNWSAWWPTLEELGDGARAYQVEGRRSVTIAVHTDGRREYIAASIPSLLARIRGPVVKKVIFDDSGDVAYKAWLEETFGPLGFRVVGPDRRLGYTGSMRALWSYLDRRCSSEYVFLAEDDFTYDADVELEPMIETLEDNPHLRQLALLRHPYYPRELEAGSLIAEHPDAFELMNSRPHPFLEHRLYFTANPSLFRRSLTKTPWPDAPSSERVYTELLNRDPASRFAYWGAGDELVTHIGAVRAGSGY